MAGRCGLGGKLDIHLNIERQAQAWSYGLFICHDCMCLPDAELLSPISHFLLCLLYSLE